MSRMSTYMNLELFRNDSNNETIDNLQTMVLCGLFDDKDEEDLQTMAMCGLFDDEDW